MLTIKPQATIYDDIIARMQTGNVPWVAPKGSFYLLENIVVPYIPRPTVFRIESDASAGTIADITIDQPDANNVAVDTRRNAKFTNVVLNSGATTTGLQLGRGMNIISITNRDTGEIAYSVVRATTIVASWQAFARVLFSDTLRVIDSQKTSIYSQLGTRLIEPLLPFQTLLPDIQSIQILATRLAARGLIHNTGDGTGVDDLIKALTLSSPLYRKMKKDTNEVFFPLDPLMNSGSSFGGKEAHVWLPNIAVANWVAFLGYLKSQPDVVDPLYVSEREVTFNYNGVQQRHEFDFDAYGADFLTSLARSECFRSVTISISMATILYLKICAAAYTFDLFVTENAPIGNSRLSFDLDIPFDSNLPFDSDDVDPFSDGWVGWSLTGRFEWDTPLNHVLDTFVQPSSAYPGPLCGYEGFYTQMIENQRYDPLIDLQPILGPGPIANGFGTGSGAVLITP